MRRKVLMPAICVCVAVLVPTAHAHHSHPYFYDECRSVTIEGRLDRVEFKDPHTLLNLTLDDGAGYVVEWAGLRGLTNAGVIGPAKASLVAGARVAVTGNRIRTAAEIREHFPDFKGEVSANTLDPVSIRRVGDTFSWALPPRTSLMSCGGKP
jgi:hypothetical protein